MRTILSHRQTSSKENSLFFLCAFYICLVFFLSLRNSDETGIHCSQVIEASFEDTFMTMAQYSLYKFSTPTVLNFLTETCGDI